MHPCKYPNAGYDKDLVPVYGHTARVLSRQRHMAGWRRACRKPVAYRPNDKQNTQATCRIMVAKMAVALYSYTLNLCRQLLHIIRRIVRP